VIVDPVLVVDREQRLAIEPVDPREYVMMQSLIACRSCSSTTIRSSSSNVISVLLSVSRSPAEDRT